MVAEFDDCGVGVAQDAVGEVFGPQVREFAGELLAGQHCADECLFGPCGEVAHACSPCASAEWSSSSRSAAWMRSAAASSSVMKIGSVICSQQVASADS